MAGSYYFCEDSLLPTERSRSFPPGEYSVVGLAEARERYFAARKMLVAGIDPMALRKAEAETRQA